MVFNIFCFKNLLNSKINSDFDIPCDLYIEDIAKLSPLFNVIFVFIILIFPDSIVFVT